MQLSLRIGAVYRRATDSLRRPLQKLDIELLAATNDIDALAQQREPKPSEDTVVETTKTIPVKRAVAVVRAPIPVRMAPTARNVRYSTLNHIS